MRTSGAFRRSAPTTVTTSVSAEKKSLPPYTDGSRFGFGSRRKRRKEARLRTADRKAARRQSRFRSRQRGHRAGNPPGPGSFHRSAEIEKTPPAATLAKPQLRVLRERPTTTRPGRCRRQDAAPPHQTGR